METKVLTQEELTQLRDLQNQQNTVLMNLGSLEYRMSLLEQTKIELKSQVLEIEKMNNELGAKLTEKYGSGNLNLETGEITIE
jgi:glycerol kinase